MQILNFRTINEVRNQSKAEEIYAQQVADQNRTNIKESLNKGQTNIQSFQRENYR